MTVLPYFQQAPTEPWMWLYAMYIAWIAGISMFYLLASHPDGVKLVRSFSDSSMIIIPTLWIMASVLLAGVAWPYLFMLPAITLLSGAPWGAAIIMWGYATFVFWSSGKCLLARFPARA